MLPTHQRPDPDELLKRVQTEEERRARGKLKIFLGYAAGVGKTYAMLEAAGQRMAEGVDVVVGYIDSHGRVETEAMLGKLEVVPRRQVEYRGVVLDEMDIDAILARRPALVLVDELAHTNVPGSRHPKRYHDVEELLDAGIDVNSTLNIQHLESVNDAVAQVTGIVVRETVPDRILDLAADIEVIDLPPEELLQRLREGKVYVPDQAAHAVQQFFRQGNLTALREMALRRAAERVDEQMRDYMATRAIPGPWPAGERLLVSVSTNPLGERLVRAARRLADELNAEWFVLYVETAAQAGFSSAQRAQVTRTLDLAEQLGARTATLPGHDVAETLLAYARQHNITKIIVGKPPRSRWIELLRGSVVDELIRCSGAIDVYVISGQPAREMPPHPTRIPLVQTRSLAYAVLLVALATALGWPIAEVLSPVNLVMPYLAVVLIAGLYLGRAASIVTAVLGVIAFDFFFVPPRYTMAVSDTEYLLTFLGLFVVGLVVSTLAVRAREQSDAAQRRSVQTSALYSFSRDLGGATSLTDVTQVINRHMCENFGREVVILLPGPHGKTLEPMADAPPLDENELAVASWAFEHGQPAGRGSDTLPAATIGFLPLKVSQGVLGVVGVRAPGTKELLDPEQRAHLQLFVNQAAAAIERVLLVEQAGESQVLRETDKLQRALLNSISHDLRTPLAVITGSLSALQDETAEMDGTAQRSLIQTAVEEADRLNRLVGNLLDMTRLEAGALNVRRETADVSDLIGAALERQNDRLQDRSVEVQVPPGVPPVPLDFALIVQVLVNLLDNAVKYSPAGTPIEISASASDDSVQIGVADRGVGIAPADLQRVFDKFYRGQHPPGPGGTGLGLAICRGIVEAHGGCIWAENRKDGGTVVAFRLPLPRALRDGEAIC